MGLITFIATLPLAPVRGVIALAEVIQRQVEDELHNPTNVRRDLEELEESRARGEISAEEEEQAQQEILNRLTPPPQERPPTSEKE